MICTTESVVSVEKKCHPLALPIDPHDFNRALDRFEHHQSLTGDHGPDAAVQVDLVVHGKFFEFSGQRFCRARLFAVFGRPSPPLFLLALGQLEDVTVGAQPGYHAKARAELIVQRLPQAVVAEPCVGDRDDACLSERRGDVADHGRRLLKFAFKLNLGRNAGAVDPFDALFHMIEPPAQRQARPAAFDDLEQTDGDNVLSPRVLGLILFGGMIEELVASVNFPARPGIDVIIQSQQQSAVCHGFRYHLPKRRPQAIPGDLRGSHEGVKALFGDSGKTEKGIEASQYIGRFRRGERDDDGNDGVDKPNASRIGFSGTDELIFELSEDVV